ncbi:MAG: SNF2 helicase associated domain-containing protein, partial [Myxococcota bacterium]|nr:SNF2 helicase associated domain-containing protein [Myxococcota bacterium]
MTRIRLSRKDGRLIEAECTCPQEHGYCKHMVALALTALADPTLRSAESAGWGRILDHAADVASEFGDVSDNNDRLAVRLGLPLNPDDAVRVRLFKCRVESGLEMVRAFSADEVKRALFEDSDVLGLKRPNDVIAARMAGLLEPYDEEELLADESNLDLLLRALSRVEHVFMGNSDKRLNIRLEAVRPRVRADALKNGGLSLKIQVIINGKRRTLDKRCRVMGSPLSTWLFDGDSSLMPIVGGPGAGPIIYGLSRRQARMPVQEVPTFLARGLVRMRELIRVEAEQGVLPAVGEVEPILILGEDGESLKVQLSFRYGEEVELQVFSEASPSVLTAPEGHDPPYVIRDREAEREAMEACRRAGLPVKEDATTVLLDTSDGLSFLEEYLEPLGETWTVLGKERLQRFKTRLAVPVLKGTIRSTVDAFEVNLQVVVSDSTFGLDALLQLYQSGKRYITLDDGSLALVPDEWVTHHLQVAMELPHLLVAGGIGLVPRFYAPVLDALIGDAELEVDEEWARLSDRLRNFDGLNSEPLPKGLQAELRPYQKHGYDWLCFL